jgi:hypothetical protein
MYMAAKQERLTKSLSSDGAYENSPLQELFRGLFANPVSTEGTLSGRMGRIFKRKEIKMTEMEVAVASFTVLSRCVAH